MVPIGLFFLVLGGFAAGSFYIPFRKVQNWAWESYWLISGVFSWIISPWIIALITIPSVITVIRGADGSSMTWSFIFGVLWGVGGLTFGLSMRYLGMSLGYALALGACAVFGTILPPIYYGTFGELLDHVSGRVTLGGVAVCVIGIAVCGWAGICKEKGLPDEQKRDSVKEFHFVKGVVVALFSGIMSACMAFGIQAGRPIAERAVEMGASGVWQNNVVLVIVLAGGFLTNVIWCLLLNLRNKTTGDYLNVKTPLLSNYLFSSLAGTAWYMQFMFYGMATTQMGRYAYTSWTIHMAMIIIFSNIWGFVFKEWKGVSRKTIYVITAGLSIVLCSILLIGAGNYLEYIGK